MMPARISRIALLLTLVGSSTGVLGPVAATEPNAGQAKLSPVTKTSGAQSRFEPHIITASQPPKIAMLIATTLAQQPAPLDGALGSAEANDSTLDTVQVDSTGSLADDERVIQSGTSDALVSQVGSQPGGLQPFPSNDILEALSAPSILTVGPTPESASAKRGLDRVGLPQNRGWMLRQVCWQSSNVCHQPLYFEDAMLERHGHQRFPALQPMISGSKFMASVVLLPYLTTLHHPDENRYTLGHFRPGSCAPALKDTLPWDHRAAAAEALGVTGVLVGLPW